MSLSSLHAHLWNLLGLNHWLDYLLQWPCPSQRAVRRLQTEERASYMVLVPIPTGTGQLEVILSLTLRIGPARRFEPY